MPTLNDLYYTFVGNINLEPEFTTQYDLGFTYSRTFNGTWLRSLEVQTDVYYNEVENKIVATPTSNFFRWTMVNLGNVEIRGVDVALQTGWKIGRELTVSNRINYTYQRAQDFTDQEDLNPRWKRAFDQMQAQAKRMNALVNDLLLLSRLENDKQIAKNQIIDMPSLMNQLYDDAHAYNIDYGHTLNLDIDSHCDLIGSDMELASAFSNLITNAIKYTPKGGTVTMGWHDNGEQAYFTVEDTGIGIDPKHLPRLTERFYRVDSARSRQTGGTGLGLAIVKHVLMQHQAHLEIESKENQGSIFKVIFPKERTYNPE
jgi:signal transduction histidine kinase